MVNYQNLARNLPELRFMDRGTRTRITVVCVLDSGLAELIIGFDKGNIVWLVFLYGKVNSVLKSPEETLSPIKILGWCRVET
jgi:hypothetical protein